METLIETAATLGGVIVFASLISAAVEGLVEKFVKPLTDRITSVEVADYVALVLCVVMAIGFQIDALTQLAEAAGLMPLSPWFGIITTGLVLGRGANFLHDIWPGSTARNK